jgi:hypothetical protein
VGLPIHLLGRLIGAAGADLTRFTREGAG